MTEQQYVPSTFLVRLQYSRLATKTESEQELEDEFDRWFAAELTAAWDEGVEHLAYKGLISIEDYEKAQHDNPYRNNRGEGDDHAS